jgi:hypothetical protein
VVDVGDDRYVADIGALGHRRQGWQAARCICAIFAIGLAVHVGSAAADARRDGLGFAVADDGGPATLNTQYFDRLRPHAFRFMVPWNVAYSPAAIARANAIISTVRAHGVRQVVVSFNHDGDRHSAPGPAQYTSAVESFVRQFAGVVDAWGPANEPNCAGGWAALNGTAGAQLTSQYYNILLFLIRSGADPTATMLSPDFCDSYSAPGAEALSIGRWMTAYEGGASGGAPGGFGDVIAWHPYWDMHYRGAGRVGPRNVSSTQDLIDSVNAPAVPIWVTEVGGFGVNPGRGIQDHEATQNEKVGWLVGSLAHQPRITRLYAYSMYGNPGGWDTGLLRGDGSPRPSWFTWCVESHGGDALHPDCAR